MPICKKCNKSFKTKEQINGKEKNLQNRKYCLDCSPFGEHNTRKIDDESRKVGNVIACRECKKEFVYKGKGNKCQSCWSNKRRFDLKKKCIEYKGGKCNRCGFDKCSRALTFHHIDQDKKEFGISGSHCQSWEVLQNELDKCTLLCMNCHMELHDELDNPLDKKDLIE